MNTLQLKFGWVANRQLNQISVVMCSCFDPYHSIIGKGSFGQVLKVFDHRTNKVIALKAIRNKQKYYQQALIEIKLLEFITNEVLNRLIYMITWVRIEETNRMWFTYWIPSCLGIIVA